MSTNERNLITYQNHLLPCSHFTPLLAASTGYAPLSHSHSHSHFHSHCATHICVSAFVIALFISRLLAHNNKLGWPWHGLRIVVIVVVYCLFANLRLGWGRAGRLAVAVVVVVAFLMLMRGNNKWQQVFIESNSNKNNNMSTPHERHTSFLPPAVIQSILTAWMCCACFLQFSSNYELMNNFSFYPVRFGRQEGNVKCTHTRTHNNSLHTLAHTRVHLPLPRQLHSQCKIPFTGHTRGHWHLSGLHSFAIQISLNHSPALSSHSLSVWFSCSLELHTNTNMQAHIMLCLCNLLARQLSNEAVNAISACKSVITLTVYSLRVCVSAWEWLSNCKLHNCLFNLASKCLRKFHSPT